MSTASGSAIAPSVRRLPFSVYLAPDFVNPLIDTQSAGATQNLSGLLLGVNDNTGLHVRETYPGDLSAERFNGTSSGRAMLAEAQKKAASKGLSVVGWYALRKESGLGSEDIQFHNRHFPHPSDVGIVVRPEVQTDIAFELYCRSAEGVLSEADHRWGLLRVTRGAPLAASAEITMRSPMRDDFFLRAYNEPYDAGDGTEKSVAKYLPIVAAASRRVGMWLAFVLIFGLAAALAFVAIRYKFLSSGTASVRNTNSPLGLKLQAEGARILVTWDRSGVAQSASSGRLLIDDGAQHRILTLDAGQLANGSVLYTPNNAEVSFHLEVQNPMGGTVDETLRVLDASKDTGDGSPLKLKPSPSGLLENGLQETRPNSPAPASNRKIAAETRRPANTASSEVTPANHVPEVPARTSTTNENELARQTGSGNAIADSPTGGEPKPPSTPIPNSGSQVATNSPTQSSSEPLERKPVEQKPAETTPPPATNGAAATGTNVRGAEPIQNSGTRDSGARPTSQNSVAQNRLPVSPERPAATPPAPQVLTPTNALPSSYRAPQPLRQVMPDTHFLAPGITANGGRVEVTVKINEQGRVTDAQLGSSPRKISSALTAVAIRAARDWRFQPATMNGKPIASEHTILFVFNPLKR